jgi:hypothetical protein
MPIPADQEKENARMTKIIASENEINASIPGLAYDWAKWNSSVLSERPELRSIWEQAHRVKRGKGSVYFLIFPSIESALHMAEFFESVAGLAQIPGFGEYASTSACGRAAERIRRAAS